MTKKAKTAMTDTSGAKQVQSAPAVSDAAPVNWTYKSTLFIMLFQDKNNLLELYNAVSGKHYTDPEILEINTLENAIYMTVKNDISFLIDGRLSLYEHQSTYNPNLPLRFLIFYNGKEELPERAVLNLSDMYEKEDPHAGLQLSAVMLNISGENNQKLKEACRTLNDYAIYTDKVRRYAEESELADAVERAIRECIEEGVLKDFLEKHRAEAKEMSIFEYDQEKHMRQEREEAWEDGRAAGVNEGIQLTKQILQLSHQGESPAEIARKCNITLEQVKKILE